MLRNYNPKEVSMIIAGNIVTGYADGSYLTIERNEDSFTLQIGSDGEGVRSKSNNRSGRFTFTVQQGAAINDILSGLLAADEARGAGTFSVLVKDNQGTSIHAAATAWVVRSPSAEYARDVGSREWIVETDNLRTFVGGNFAANG